MCASGGPLSRTLARSREVGMKPPFFTHACLRFNTPMSRLQGPEAKLCSHRRTPLDLSFWSFLTFLHHDIEEVEGHLLWQFYKNIRRKSWSNVPPKLLAYIGFLYKGVQKIGRLQKFNRSRENEFNFLTAWTISMKFGTLVQHAPGYKSCLRLFIFCLGT